MILNPTNSWIIIIKKPVITTSVPLHLLPFKPDLTTFCNHALPHFHHDSMNKHSIQVSGIHRPPDGSTGSLGLWTDFSAHGSLTDIAKEMYGKTVTEKIIYFSLVNNWLAGMRLHVMIAVELVNYSLTVWFISSNCNTIPSPIPLAQVLWSN